jgi:phenylalanyl-tRNA synthetase beta chain
MVGYDRVPETILASAIPSQGGDKALLQEERLRDLLATLGLVEVATYRLTSPERESRLYPPDAQPDSMPYVRMLNPMTADRSVMRHSLLSSLLEVVERNARLRERMALFEIGPVFHPVEGQLLPNEPLHLALALTGPRHLASWQSSGEPGVPVGQVMDFFDFKGLLEELFAALHLSGVRWEPTQHPTYHPGKCARILIGERQVGTMGEVHPLVREHYDLPPTPLLAGELDVQIILEGVPEQMLIESVPAFPPVLEDLAVVVDESTPAVQVADLIRQAGGKVVQSVRLFDLYRSTQIGAGKKSLAYSITYQASDRTLTDKDVAGIRQKILRRLEQELGAKLRS